MPDKFDKGKIINTENVFDFIYIKYIPEEFTESVEADYEEQTDIIGRSSPFVYYKSTGARKLEFNLFLFAEGDAEEEIKNRVRWLQSFQYPDYSGQVMRPPKKVQIVLGRNFIQITGILRGCSVTWKAPYDTDNGVPMHAEIGISLQEVVDIPYGYQHFKPAIMRREDDVGITSV